MSLIFPSSAKANSGVAETAVKSYHTDTLRSPRKTNYKSPALIIRNTEDLQIPGNKNQSSGMKIH